MLKQLRDKKTAKKIWIILAIIVVPPFIFWGSGSLVRSKQESGFIAKIGNKNVSSLEFQDALEAVRNQAIIQFGDNYEQIKKYLNLQEEAWERIILLEEARKRKISATDREVIELIESYPFFQRKGRFDNRIYSEMLQYAFRIQPRRFEEESRQNIILSKLFKMLTDDIQASDEEVRQEYRKANEKIRLIYIAALPSEFAKNINPSAEEIKDYFVKNSLKFKRPPSLNLEYIVLEPDAKSKGAIKRLAKKGSFHRVAKDLNLPVKETGVFAQTELIPGLGWSAEILPLVTKLKPGQHTAPIQIDKQLYVFCVKEKLDAYLPELEKVQDGVKITLVQEESQGLAKNKIEECLKKIRELQQEGAKDIDFNKAAGEFGLKSGPTEPFGYGSYIEGIGASDIFWDAASKLQNGEVSGVLAVPGGFYIIKVKERMPIDENKFSSEKTDFSRKVLLQKKQEYFVKFLADLKKK